MVSAIGLRPLFLPVLLLCLLAAACGSSFPSLERGKPVPDVTLPGMSGESVTLPAALRGQVVLIHFWADWCPLCIEELQGSSALARRYRQAGLSVVAVNLEQTPQQVTALLERLDLGYPVLFDRQGEAARRYGVSGLPMSYLIDREGRLQRRIVGAMSSWELEQLVKQML